MHFPFSLFFLLKIGLVPKPPCQKNVEQKQQFYIVNKQIIDDKNTVLMKYNTEAKMWVKHETAKYSYKNNKLELNIPREELGITENGFVFDFKWSDNPDRLDDPISLATGGDSAPDRRFNYRCIWEK